ncbi:MAG: hypothetical protein ACREMO_00780 [Gemmatimonadales bacterium]
MQPRTEILGGVALLVALGFAAGTLGRRRNPAPVEDRRRSSYLPGPSGVLGLSEALERLGIRVEHFRRRTVALATNEGADSSPPGLLAVLDPWPPINGSEAADLADYSRSGDLLLAGATADRAMQCFGFGVESRYRDSLRVAPPGVPVGAWAVWAQAVLARPDEAETIDSSRAASGIVRDCRQEMEERVDTLLRSSGGRLVAVRLHPAAVSTSVLLVADGHLFENRTVRRTAAGPFWLELLARGHRVVRFDEYHQGFGPSGSLASATLAWSRSSPWGWAVWQLAGVGLLALLAGAIRFGPPRTAIVRRRRSPSEHVRALATALAAARGHDVAIGAIVNGLRRRLSPAGAQPRADRQTWLTALAAGARTPRAQAAVHTLARLARPPQPAESVLGAAYAVEDLWEELRP